MAPLRVAADTLLLGLHGEIHAGQEVPATYIDSLGQEQSTDLVRLDELGLLLPEGAEPFTAAGVEGAGGSDGTDDGLDGLKPAELRRLAVEAGLEVSGKKKQAFVDALREHAAQNADPDAGPGDGAGEAVAGPDA